MTSSTSLTGSRRTAIFSTNVATYDEDHTDCIVNLIAGVNAAAVLSIMNRFYAIDSEEEYDQVKHGSVQRMKAAFGRQATTKLYTRRCRIWTFSSGNAIIYAVASVEGISWEYNTETDPTPGEIIALLSEVVSASKERNS